PANGAPVTVPSQDMVLGLYYITKPKKSTKENPIKGAGLTFYSSEEVIIALNEDAVDMHAEIKVLIKDKIIETTVGRVIFNQHIPEEVAYVNEVLTKKSLRTIIGNILKICGTSKTAKFLDDIKSLGYKMAFEGGLSFNLGDVIIPDVKQELVDEGYRLVEEVMNNFNMGFIANNERYNQIIDIWTHTNARLTQQVMNTISKDKDGFNSVYMMLDSGARGSREQIRQLSGMRGLMAKPQKSGATTGQIIENPILSNFKEGLSVLEYFVSTHGARKGLADTALKTADAGYLTRRLVDVAQDVVITEEDCGTLRGLEATTIMNKDDVVETLYERILGRTTVHNIYHPNENYLIIAAGEEITEEIAQEIQNSPIETVEIRSVLTCETRQGVCAKCYGRNLSTGRMVQRGEAIGVIAAQSIGEPGTQLTLRTFHVGGVAGGAASENSISAKYDGICEFEELRTVDTEKDGKKHHIVVSRMTEMKVFDKNTGIQLTSYSIPYGARLYVKPGEIKRGELICEWDPYNALIISEFTGNIELRNLKEGITYKIEKDEQTNFIEKVIIETKDKRKNPEVVILDKDGKDLMTYNLPVGSHLTVSDGDKIIQGDNIAKIPRMAGKAGDITGGLPRVTELVEARNPSNPATVAEIDGIISFDKIKRGKKGVVITSKTGDTKKYFISLSKQILVQPGDFVKAGTPLSDGAVTPDDILDIKGATKVQEHIVNEVQEVYRLQGVKINDKHFEVIVRQMMKKVEIEDTGDTIFREKEIVDKWDFIDENDNIYGMKVIEDAGDSQNYKAGEIISNRKLRNENSMLKRKDLKQMTARDAVQATSRPVLQGITKASLGTKSFLSSASFQETTKVLNMAAISGKTDYLLGLKENVIVGHKIPAGTGMKEYRTMIVGSKEELDKLNEEKNN
ncbi:MAG: DNA-directed RNA polymerase subunit beta', partial [Bacteroidales bacterium]|nr:DNA-directed RNA polymerase subunit beta' [Bacteroidales bacterium]